MVLCCILVITLVTSGCATIFNWHHKGTVHIVSSQPNTIVEVYNRGQYVGSLLAPFNYEIRSSPGYFKRAAYEFKFVKEGFESVAERRQARFSAWYWWNILLGGAVGMLIVDPLSGSMYWIDTSPIYVDMGQQSK